MSNKKPQNISDQKSIAFYTEYTHDGKRKLMVLDVNKLISDNNCLKNISIISENQPTFDTELDAIVHSFKIMDADRINELVIDDSILPNEIPRWLFLLKLQEAFKKFSEAGDTYLHAQEGACKSTSCNYLKSGFRFVGDKSERYMDIIFVENNGRLTDIYECFGFCTDNSNMPKGKQIGIGF